jgi:predicted NAD/FAD-dependent oxidoreductase
MSSLAKMLAQGLEPVLGHAVTGLERWSGRYRATLDDGRSFEAPSLVLNLPHRQLLALAAPLLDPAWTEAISDVHLEPCFAVFGELEADLKVEWKGLELEGHPVFRWIARDHTRRAPGAKPVLVAHTTPEWSVARLEMNPTEVAAEASRELGSLLGSRFCSSPQVHRWRYAQPAAGALKAFPIPPWSAETRIGLCGDWLRGGRIEGAVLSGWNLARLILA